MATTTESAIAIEFTSDTELAPTPLPLFPEAALELGLVLLLVEVLLLEIGRGEGRLFCSGQLKSNRGFVDRLSVMANLTLLAGFASRRVYQKTFFLPKRAQPTSFQYLPAWFRVDWAAPKLGPVYAHRFR